MSSEEEYQRASRPSGALPVKTAQKRDDDAEEHHDEAEGIGQAEGEVDGGLGEDLDVDAGARSGGPGGCGR